VFILPTHTHYCTVIPSYSKKTQERNKRIQIGKEEVKLSLFSADMILYLKDPKDFMHKKLIDLINTFNNVA
jgi:hypothetical protein